MASRRTSSSASRRHAREADLARREGVSRCEASRLVPGVRSVVLAAQFESRRLPARVGPRGCSSPSVTSDVISEADARGADAGADAALRAAVKPAVERVLREAPWTFNKTNPLKDACRAFLDAVADPGVAAPELARAATRALTLACASGKAAVCEPALGAARELVARGALAGTTQTWSPDMSQSRVKALAAAAALAASDDPPPGEPGSRGDAFDVSGSSEGNRTSRANDAARRTALVVAAAKCAETNEPRVHVAVIAASLAFATSDSFRLAGDALARVVRALLHVSVAAASREDRAAAKSALATLINAVFRRAEPHFSETTDDDSLSDPPDDSLSDPPDDSLSDPPDDSDPFGSSRLRDDELVSGLLSLFASSSRLGGVRRAPVRLGAVQDRVWSRGIRRRGERGGVPRAFQNRRHGPSASTSRGTVRVRVVGDVSRLRARTPVRGVVARRGRGSVESVPLIVRVRVVASEPRGAKRVRGASRVGARGVRGAGDSRAIVV